jgi:hypothetical protein
VTKLRRGVSETNLASEFDLFDLLGRRVRSRRPLPLLPLGSTGRVIDVSAEKGGPPRILVQWDEYNFEDSFGRDVLADETRWLEVIEAPVPQTKAGESANVLTASKEHALVAPRTSR